jgi:hypothetical protein
MRKGKHCSLKVRSVYLLVILKMSKVIDFFNHIVMKLLLEEMLNLMKISWPASLIRRLCLLRPASHLRRLCLLLFLFWFLLQMMTVRMKIHLLPTHLPLDESFEPEPTPTPHFLDGFVQHEKQLVILSVILQISVRHVHSSSEPLLFWLKFQRLMIQRHLQKLQVIQIGIQQ